MRPFFNNNLVRTRASNDQLDPLDILELHNRPRGTAHGGLEPKTCPNSQIPICFNRKPLEIMPQQFWLWNTKSTQFSHIFWGFWVFWHWNRIWPVTAIFLVRFGPKCPENDPKTINSPTVKCGTSKQVYFCHWITSCHLSGPILTFWSHFWPQVPRKVARKVAKLPKKSKRLVYTCMIRQIASFSGTDSTHILHSFKMYIGTQ